MIIYIYVYYPVKFIYTYIYIHLAYIYIYIYIYICFLFVSAHDMDRRLAHNLSSSLTYTIAQLEICTTLDNCTVMS